MEPTKDETAGSGLRLPSSPIASEQANDGTTQGRLPAVSSKRKPETTHLPSVLTDLASLEHERQRLVLELQGLKESQAAVDARLVAAEEARNARLEALGKHDRFFLKDRGQHPLGRRYAVQQTAINIQKQMERLNNERTKLLGKMNNAIDGNNAVKTRIDVLRRESVVFRGLFTKMEAELAGLKKTIASDKQAIEQAYEARDAAQLEMQEIEQELKLTKAEIEAEFTTLSVNMSSSVDFMAVPNMGDTSGSGLSTTRRSKKSGKGGSDRQASSIKKLTKAQKYAKLQEEWKAITDATGISDPDELVDFFKTAESQKFSKVTAITELVTEVSVLERELKDFADVTLADLTERREASEKQAATTKLLDDGIVTTESAIAAISDETKDILRQFEELLPVVHQTFQKIGCEKMFSEDSINQMNAAAAVVAEGGEAVVATDVTRPVLPPMFAAPSFVQAIRSGITVHNLPMFLGVIEFRASEIMQQYSALFPNGRPDPGPGNYSSRPGTTSLNLASSLGGGSPSLSAMLGTPTGLNTSRKSPFKFGAGEGASSPSTDPVAKFKAGSLGPSAPSGSVKLVVQSSAIRAAMMETERDETDDYDRPLSRMELQARAAVHANRSSNQATKSAALAAAVVLSSATDAGLKKHLNPAVLPA